MSEEIMNRIMEATGSESESDLRKYLAQKQSLLSEYVHMDVNIALDDLKNNSFHGMLYAILKFDNIDPNWIFRGESSDGCGFVKCKKRCPLEHSALQLLISALNCESLCQSTAARRKKNLEKELKTLTEKLL